MSDPGKPRPLFPPRADEVPPMPPVGDVAQRQSTVDTEMAAKIERAVLEPVMKRLGNQAMPYGLARQLVMLEGEIIAELVRVLAQRP
jgi:hypothetical protein